MSSPVIQLESVHKHYGSVHAVDGISFTVEEGQLLVLLGHSGCGKSTTLRLIAGLEAPDDGEVLLNNKIVAGSGRWTPPEKRHIGMVFQDYALFPHMTVSDNIAFPLNGLPRPQRKQRIAQMLELVGLDDYGERHPHQLSGGQQQRVALARALASNPSVILLDEPFSNLDAALRKTMRQEVRRILKAAHATAVFVTHDQEEALSIGDEVAILHKGHLQQIGTPQDVYLHPVDRRVAAFVGETNFIPGTAHGEIVETAIGTLPLLEPAHGAVDVMIRPEQLTITPSDDGSAMIEATHFYGYYQLITARLPDDTHLTVRVWAQDDLPIGTTAHIHTKTPVLAFSV